jgi:hypothetical protein
VRGRLASAAPLLAGGEAKGSHVRERVHLRRAARLPHRRLVRCGVEEEGVVVGHVLPRGTKVFSRGG